MKEQKTNAMRILEQKKIPYKALDYPHGDGPVDGASVARLTGQDPAAVFKTLVTVGASRNHYVFVIPVLRELDLKKAAAAVGEKSIAMIHVSEITALTGYVRGGCSPLGMKKKFRTVIAEECRAHKKIYVSAGKIGTSMHLLTEDLIRASEASVAKFTV